MVKMSAPAQPALPQLPAAPPAPPTFGAQLSPQGQKPGRKPSTPSFLGGAALPSASPGSMGKQLVGQ